MRLTREQVYDLARSAGFDAVTARKMVAIAQRESGFNPNVVGTINKEKETSYGLWQINWKDAGIRRLLQSNGITDPEQLFTPSVNARAAALLWGGKESNLNLAWYTERVGLSYRQGEIYRENLAKLPPVENFEARFLASRSGAVPGSVPNPDSVAAGPGRRRSVTPLVSDAVEGQDNTMTYLALGLGVFVVVLAVS